ncbi:MAG TPA: DUF484 family protein [Burkholderiales bacterium]|nr:DUF484 family protein [Burkholderiales bacterium]
MNEEDVAVFLRSHPQFFDQRPELLEAIRVPHPHGGRAISLAERQMLSLRERTRALEAKLGELIRTSEENEAISERVHRLAVALLAARDFAALAQVLYFNLREDFSVPHVVLRVWGRGLPADCVEAEAVSDAQREAAETMGGPQCGSAEGSPFLAWFGETASHLRSLALVPLGGTSIFGLLALGSEDSGRFYPEMGTLYLRRIGELCAAGVGGCT